MSVKFISEINTDHIEYVNSPFSESLEANICGRISQTMFPKLSTPSTFLDNISLITFITASTERGDPVRIISCRHSIIVTHKKN